MPYEEGRSGQFQEALSSYLKQEDCPFQSHKPALIVCRQGNDSQRVVQLMLKYHCIPAVDLRDGLLGLAKADPAFPAL